MEFTLQEAMEAVNEYLDEVIQEEVTAAEKHAIRKKNIQIKIL